jgi:hypothetical protein
MAPVFYQSPAEYRNETMRISPFWWALCPIAFTVGLLAFAFFNPSAYALMQGEDAGVLEFLHAALPLAAAAIATRLLFFKELRRDRLIMLWLLLFVLGGIYLGGEEASWGQHYFGWATPESWATINRQQETNLHNTSFWLDRLPRVVCTIAIIVGGLFLPFVKLHQPAWIPKRLDFIVPPLALSVLTVIFIIGEVHGIIVANTEFIDDVIRFRTGEMQENFIVSFILFYMIFLWVRAIRVRETNEEAAQGSRAQ